MNKKEEGMVSRRSFVKGLALAGAVGASSLTIAGCSDKPASNAQADDTEATEITLKEATDTRECDVLVVGLGASGVQAAVAAAQEGADVIAIDLAPSMLATTNINTSGTFAVQSSLQKATPNPLTVQEAYEWLNTLSNYSYNCKALRNILEASGKAVDVLIEGGLEFITEFPDEKKETYTINEFRNIGGHRYGVKGEERAEILQGILDNAGVTTLFSTTAENPLIENNELAGIQCSSDDGVIDIKAKAVILSSGGFLGNEEMVSELFAGAQIVPIGNQNCVGDGINIARKTGAQLGKTFSISMNEYGGCHPNASPTFAFRAGVEVNEALRLPVLGVMAVDNEGKRFFNEGIMSESAKFTSEPLIREGYTYYVVDDTFVSKMETTSLSELIADPFVIVSFEDVYADTIREDFDEAIQQGWAYKADTIAELAEKYDLTDLEWSVERYNTFCDAGKDDDFYTEERFLAEIKTPPFYIIQSLPGGWLSMGGIKCNGDFQAVDVENKPIANLFVTGADADIFCAPYLAGGTANGFALGSGYTAGKAAAASL